MSVARTQPLEVRVALSPLIALTRMLIDGFGGIPVSSPSSSSTSGPPAVWGDETHSMPEFMLPAPGGTRTRLREELAQVAATPSSIVRRDVAYDSVSLSGSPRPPAPFDRFVRAPRSSVQQHCLAVNEWAAQLLAPSGRWIASCLHTELLRVSRLIATKGAAAALNEVHPGVRFADGFLHVNQSDGLRVVEARGPIVLLPVISRKETLLARLPQSGPMVVLAYGAAGVETAPQAPADPGEELCALLGRTRALVLERLGTPASTSELAGGLGLAASTISQHLGAMEAMGLVEKEDPGRVALQCVAVLASGR